MRHAGRGRPERGLRGGRRLRRGLVDPLDPDAIAAGLAEAVDRRDELRALGLASAPRVRLGRGRAGHCRRLPRGGGVSDPLVVIDADVLGRQRTGDETYVRNLLGELTAAPGIFA